MIADHDESLLAVGGLGCGHDRGAERGTLMAAASSFNFFVAQRQLRRRSRALVAGVFVLLWLVLNWVLIPVHTSETCDARSRCESSFQLNAGGLVATALVAAIYLVVAPLLTSRRMVAGRHVRPAHGLDTAMLRNVVEEISISSGLEAEQIPEAFVLDDPALNAYAVCDGRRRGAVVVTSGLLEAVDRRELSGVISHELAHIRNRDSRVLLVTLYAVGAILVLAAIATAVAVAARLASGRSRHWLAGALIGVLALAAAVIAVALRFIAVPAGLLLDAAVSRRREELADASAVQFTRDPGGLRLALEKIAASREAPRVGLLARALCIEHRPGPRTRGWLNRWMHTHPPIERRIAWLRSLEGAEPAFDAALLPATATVSGMSIDWRSRSMQVAAVAIALSGLLVVGALAGRDNDTQLAESSVVSTASNAAASIAATNATGASTRFAATSVVPTPPDRATTAPAAATPTAARAAETMTTLIASTAAPSTSAPRYDLTTNANCAMRAAARLGSSGDDVRCLQQRLDGVTSGASPMAVDGQFGPATDAAVRAFQRANGLTVDGIVGAQTAERLGIWDPAPAQPAVGRSGGCDAAYPDVCIPSRPPDLDCGDIAARRFTVRLPDPHNFDGDNDGIGCEAN